ncbi:MAG: hypothetical protein JWP88_46 [Flaviaesturariibacter sp.]|nr:hypothetical protein [Flaviaesturariibacter sp.]
MENSKGQNRNDQQGQDQQSERLSNPSTVGGQQNTGSGMKNTSGATTDLGRNRQGGSSSAGISTKRSVSGSDFDGQVSPD